MQSFQWKPGRVWVEISSCGESFRRISFMHSSAQGRARSHNSVCCVSDGNIYVWEIKPQPLVKLYSCRCISPEHLSVLLWTVTE